MTSYSTSAPVGTSDWILGAIKRNPEGLLLLAAGCALMMRRQSATPVAPNPTKGRVQPLEQVQEEPLAKTRAGIEVLVNLYPKWRTPSAKPQVPMPQPRPIMPTPQYARSQRSRDELFGRPSPGGSTPRNTCCRTSL